MTAAFKALLLVLSAPSAHAINVHPALQQDASRADAHDKAAEVATPARTAEPTWTQVGRCVPGPAGQRLLVQSDVGNQDSYPDDERAAACWSACVSHASYGCCRVNYYYNPARCHWGPGTIDLTAEFNPAQWSANIPTLAPTPAPTISEVSGTGDPHLRNLRGEHFDIYRPGVPPLLHVPRLAEPARTLLLVEADARRMGGACSIYFQVVTISGVWTNESKPIQFLANPHGAPAGRNWKEWMRFGSIELKVAHQTKGVDYLNVYARNVSKNGYEVGGLLGLDDHSAFATRPRECAHNHAATLWSSVAAAL